MFGPAYRLYFGIKSEQLVLLLIGGDKASQRKDITQAKKFWREYLEEQP